MSYLYMAIVGFIVGLIARAVLPGSQSLGIILTTVLGVPLTGYEASILVVGTVMVLYTVVGGLWAAVLSDAVQSIIIVVMTVIIFPVSYLYLGDGGGLISP